MFEKILKSTRFSILILLYIVLCIAGFNLLIVQQENILRKYFIIQPQERMKEYNNSLSNSLSKYFSVENKASNITQVTDYIKKYGRTSLFEMLFVFKDRDGLLKQISKIGLTTVTTEILSSERVYPVTVDNGNIRGYLIIMIKETSSAEFDEGLRKYKGLSYSLRFLFLLLIAALMTIALYHTYSAKMKLARDMAEIKASYDGLTGLHTHEYFIKVLNIEVDRSRIYNTPIALMMLDIDQFKTLNDRFGHLAGDSVLQEVAKIIKYNTRATDILARYGGEEFAAIIPYAYRLGEKPDKDSVNRFMEEVKNVADRIRKNVEDCKIEYLSNVINVTISIGIAFHHTRSDNITSTVLLHRADAVLYSAKKEGRNRIQIDYGPHH